MPSDKFAGLPFPSIVPERIRVVFATRALLSFISTWRAATLVLVDLGAVAFFASGVAEAHIGPSAPWFVLAAVLVGFCFAPSTSRRAPSSFPAGCSVASARPLVPARPR